MATQPTVVVGGSVEGNIGSCKVEYTSIPVSSFYKNTVAVNSCSGEVISQNTWYDWGYIYGPGTFLLGVVVVLVIWRTIFD